jgi:hypothetical protein
MPIDSEHRANELVRRVHRKLIDDDEKPEVAHEDRETLEPGGRLRPAAPASGAEQADRNRNFRELFRWQGEQV